jgi:hypothetical protein
MSLNNSYPLRGLLIKRLRNRDRRVLKPAAETNKYGYEKIALLINIITLFAICFLTAIIATMGSMAEKEENFHWIALGW